MPARKPKSKSRLTEIEAQKRAEDRRTRRNLRWKQIAFVTISVIVLLSMVLSLLITQ